jgi:hypothetical protein
MERPYNIYYGESAEVGGALRKGADPQLKVRSPCWHCAVLGCLLLPGGARCADASEQLVGGCGGVRE